eukprot:1091147-Heterocapsa_arctica.AAC.2
MSSPKCQTKSRTNQGQINNSWKNLRTIPVVTNDLREHSREVVEARQDQREVSDPPAAVMPSS